MTGHGKAMMVGSDLGNGWRWSFFCWGPDRDLNPQYADIPDVDPAGIIVWIDDKAVCSCWFDIPGVMAIPGSDKLKRWQLVSLDPLHLEPSIQMYRYDSESAADDKMVPWHHGFIRGGVWVGA